MTEREELELAAKAAQSAGAEIIFSEAGPQILYKVEENGDQHYRIWNPCTDKADALDLAELVGMNVCFFYGHVENSDIILFGEEYECKTACEAITRAAALYQKAREGK